MRKNILWIGVSVAILCFLIIARNGSLRADESSIKKPQVAADTPQSRQIGLGDDTFANYEEQSLNPTGNLQLPTQGNQAKTKQAPQGQRIQSSEETKDIQQLEDSYLEQPLDAKSKKALARQEKLRAKQEKAKQRQDELKAKKEEAQRSKDEAKARQENNTDIQQATKELEQKLKSEQDKTEKLEASLDTVKEKERQLYEQLDKKDEMTQQLQQELKNHKDQDKQKEKEEKLKAQQEAQSKLRAERVSPQDGTLAQAQESALSQALANKHKEDEVKIQKIETLWREARQLYNDGRYSEARRYFQEVIRLEGNPRIRYTPLAKKYLDVIERKQLKTAGKNYKMDLENIEGAMLNDVLAQQVAPYVEPPMRIEKNEVSYLVEPPAIRKKLKKLINLDFDKVDLKSVISFIAQEAGVNVVASSKVLEAEPKVTVSFVSAPVDEVVKFITKSLGLVYRIDNDVIWIAHPEEVAAEQPETRVYYLSKGGGLFTEFTPIAATSADTGLGGSSAQISKITTIEDTLKDAIPWPQDAKLTYDKRLNALIVRNTPQNLQMLEDILYTLDITPIQVLIEARFLEVDVTDSSEFGFDWKLNGDAPLANKNGSFEHGVANNSGFDFASFTNAASGLNLTYKGVLTDPQFQTVLHAFAENKKIKTLSSPRVTTLNNQLATIKVVDEWIYPTRYEYEIVQFDLNGDGDYNDAGETTYKNVPKDFLRRDVGILLKVIPSVGADKKTVNLSLIPEVSEATADAFVYTGDVKLPKFTSRNLSTTIVVNSGDTVVLGGLIKESRTKDIVKIPFLGDIPLLGGFFKKDADVIERKNLLIFVTARVLSPGGDEIVAINRQ